jgi:hypothetical protein
MQFRSSFKLVLVLALLVSGIAFLGARSLRTVKDGTVPIVFEIQPSKPMPNSQVAITVYLDSPTSTGQVVNIGCTDAQAFIDLPTEVVVPAGESSVSFNATTSSVFTDWAVLAATSNGGTALAVSHD